MTTPRTKAAAAAAETVEKPIGTVLQAGKDTVETFVKTGTDATHKSIEQAMQLSQEQIEKASAALFKGYDEFATFSKDNVDAVFKAGSIYAKGVEQVSKAVLALTQAHLNNQVAAIKAVMGATSLRQFVDMQTDLAKTNFDKYVAEGSKLSEISLKVANEALEPIQARVTATVEKLMKPAQAA